MYIPLPHLSTIAWVLYALGSTLTIAGSVRLVITMFQRTGSMGDNFAQGIVRLYSLVAALVGVVLILLAQHF